MINIYNPYSNSILKFDNKDEFVTLLKKNKSDYGILVGNLFVLKELITCNNCEKETTIFGLFSNVSIYLDDDVLLINKYVLSQIEFIQFEKNKHIKDLLETYFKPFNYKNSSQKFYQNYCRNCGEKLYHYYEKHNNYFDYGDNPIELIENVELKIKQFNTNIFCNSFTEKIILYANAYFDNPISSKEVFDLNNKLFESKIL